jgi:uncharacterized protein (TIGR02246 family)
MSPALLLLGLLAVAAGQDEPKAAPGRPEDVQAIEALGRAFTAAYNAGDADAIAALFTEDAEILDEGGVLLQGRGDIAALFAATFEGEPGSTIELASESIRFLGPDVAREVGHARTVPADGSAPDRSRYVVVYVREDGKWLHDTVEEHDDRTLSAHERLEDLAWMVGDWVDEGEEGIVHFACRWSDDGNFLLRDFTLRVEGFPFTSGHQRIGWDAAAESFRSWVFDSDGGHSTGTWSRGEGGRWVIKAEGVLADGRTATATQLFAPEGPDRARWHSIDRTVGGHAMADAPEVVLIRRPPAPKGDVPAPSNNPSR